MDDNTVTNDINELIGDSMPLDGGDSLEGVDDPTAGDNPGDETAVTSDLADDTEASVEGDASQSDDTQSPTTEPDTPGVADQVAAEGTSAGAEGDQLVTQSVDEIRQLIVDLATPKAEEKSEEINLADLFKDDIDYITQDNLNDIAENPMLLNGVMNQVRRQTAENILTIVPHLIGKAIQEHTVRQEQHNAFYTQHKELAPYKAYVSALAQQVQEKMKDKTPAEILEVVAKSAKANLKLSVKSAVPAEGKKEGGKPALRKANSGGRGAQKSTAPAVDSMAAQINELLI